jgi:hypothetical protein
MFTWLNPARFPLLLFAGVATNDLCLCGKNPSQQGAAT